MNRTFASAGHTLAPQRHSLKRGLVQAGILVLWAAFLCSALAPRPVAFLLHHLRSNQGMAAARYKDQKTGTQEAQLPPAGRVTIGGPIGPDGKTEVMCDLPVSERIRNIGSKVDGAGMCVMSSCEMSARWANLEQLCGLRDWCARYPGGGYPAKVDEQLKQYCRQKGVEVPAYVQYEGKDPGLLKAVLKSGRMPSVTYSGRDGVRYRGPIAHMTCLVHLDDRLACILDNNRIGENDLLWMSPEDFFSRWRGTGSGWAVMFLAPPPPPPPKN